MLYGHRQTGAVEWLLFRRQDGHRAEDRSCDPHLFEDHALRFLRRYCAGEFAGDRSSRWCSTTPRAACLYYGGAASAPVFAQVAQDTLEYLGVPHDVEIHAVRPSSKDLTAKDVEPEQEHTGDVNALIAAVNDLPADDPLREAVSSARAPASNSVTVKLSSKAQPKDDQKKAEEAKTKVDETKLPIAPGSADCCRFSAHGQERKSPFADWNAGSPGSGAGGDCRAQSAYRRARSGALVRSPRLALRFPPGSQIVVHCAQLIVLCRPRHRATSCPTHRR